MILEYPEQWEKKQQGCPAAREWLICRYLPISFITANRFAQTAPLHISIDDLTSEAMIGLCLSVDRFDPTRQVKFTSYAITTMRGRMLEFLRRDDWVPRLERERERRGEVVIRAVTSYEQETEGEWCPPVLVAPSPEEAILAGIDEALVSRLACYLPPKERLLIHLTFNGKSINSLAEEWGESSTGMKRIQLRALHRMRCWLERTGAVSAA